MRNVQLESISEEVVKATAGILGPQSAAANAIEDARRRSAAGERVEFFKVDNCIVVRGTRPQ